MKAPPKQTSSRVSTLAGHWLEKTKHFTPTSKVIMTVRELRTLAGSALSQDQKKGQASAPRGARR